MGSYDIYRSLNDHENLIAVQRIRTILFWKASISIQILEF